MPTLADIVERERTGRGCTLILLYRGTSWLSKAIRFLTWSTYSHSSISFSDIAMGRLCGDKSEWEAWATFMPFNDFFRHPDYIGKLHGIGSRIDIFDFRVPLSRDEKERMAQWLIAQVGVLRYDFRGIVQFIYRHCAEDPTKMFCSEAVLTACRQVPRMVLNIEPWQCSPGDLAKSTELEYKGYLIVGEDGFLVHQDPPGPLSGLRLD